jgi:hypothetical protein
MKLCDVGFVKFITIYDAQEIEFLIVSYSFHYLCHFKGGGDKEATYLTVLKAAGFGNIFCKFYCHQLIISHVFISVIIIAL